MAFQTWANQEGTKGGSSLERDLSEDDIDIPVKFGDTTILATCKIDRHLKKPFVLGMQFLITFGFSFGLNEHCIVFKERPAEIMTGIWPHNKELPGSETGTTSTQNKTHGKKATKKRVSEL